MLPLRRTLIQLARSLLPRQGDVKTVGICLLAAAAFWLLNALDQDYVTTISYPVRVVGEGKVEGQMHSVQLNVTGYGWSLLRHRLQLQQPPLVYRVEGQPNGQVAGGQLLPLAAEQIRDLQVNYIVDDSLPRVK